MPSIFSANGLKGRRALVTGGSAGIGRAISIGLAAAGAKVTIANRNKEEGKSLADEISATAIALDVTDSDAVKSAAHSIGTIDILVNNAGVDQHNFFVNSDEEEWRRLIAVNLEGVLACTKAFLPAMQEQKFGRLINISSEAGRRGSKGGAVYAATKGAVNAFTKSIAQESARFNVTSNVICPGPVKTPLLEKAVEAGGEKLLQTMVGATLLGRLGAPEEVAALVVFLASDEAAFITGEIIGVSGGMGV